MRSNRKIVVCLLSLAFFSASVAVAQPPETTGGDNQTGQPPRRMRASDPLAVHDPSSIVTADGVHRFFSTGWGVTLMRQDATGQWNPEGRLFAQDALPPWHAHAVPGNRGHLWAPDVIELDDQYFVYYSVSTFGSNLSAIGLAVGSSLDPNSPQFAGL